MLFRPPLGLPGEIYREGGAGNWKLPLPMGDLVPQNNGGNANTDMMNHERVRNPAVSHIIFFQKDDGLPVSAVPS